MRNHHVFRPLSGLAVLCLIGVLALAAPATARAWCENIPQLEREVRTGDVGAPNHLGCCSHMGQGVPQDVRRARPSYTTKLRNKEVRGASTIWA